MLSTNPITNSTSATALSVDVEPIERADAVSMDLYIPPHGVTSDERRAELRGKVNFFTRDSSGGTLTRSSRSERKEALKDQFLDVRDIVLNHAIDKGYIALEHLNAVEDFEILFRRGIATFTHPSSNEKFVIDLMNLPDDMQAEVDRFFDAADKVIHFSHHRVRFSKESKGNIRGTKPFQRTTEDLQKLPKDHQGVAKKILPKLVLETEEMYRNDIINREIFVQHTQQSMIRQFSQSYNQKKTEMDGLIALSAPQERDHQQRIENLAKDLRILKQSIAQLRVVNIYVLVEALAKFPVGAGANRAEDIDQVANRLVESIKQELHHKEKAEASPGFLAFNFESARKKNKDAEKEAEFAKEVAGMLYRTRWEYIEYCEKHNLPIKQESIEDIFFREAIRFIENPAAYDGKGFIESALFVDCSGELKTEISQIITTMANDLRRDFPRCDADQFHVETGNPANATDAMEKKISKYRMKAFGSEESTAVLIPKAPPLPSNNVPAPGTNPQPNRLTDSQNAELDGIVRQLEAASSVSNEQNDESDPLDEPNPLIRQPRNSRRG